MPTSTPRRAADGGIGSKRLGGRDTMRQAVAQAQETRCRFFRTPSRTRPSVARPACSCCTASPDRRRRCARGPSACTRAGFTVSAPAAARTRYDVAGAQRDAVEPAGTTRPTACFADLRSRCDTRLRRRAVHGRLSGPAPGRGARRRGGGSAAGQPGRRERRPAAGGDAGPQAAGRLREGDHQRHPEARRARGRLRPGPVARARLDARHVEADGRTSCRRSRLPCCSSGRPWTTSSTRCPPADHAAGLVRRT